MKLNDFLESTYVSTNLDLQNQYSVFKQSKTQACQSLINAQRWTLKVVSYWALIGQYLLVCMGFLTAPPHAKEVIKEFNDKLAEEKKAKTPTLVETSVESDPVQA